jgi:hypothetical protein
MISRFSAARCIAAPSYDGAFFQQAIFQHRLSQGLLQLRGLAARPFDFIGVRFPCGITSQAFLAGLQKLLRPAVIQVLVDAFLAAQLSDAGFTTQAFQHDADLLFG